LNLQEIIESGLLESYVLGTATPEEVTLVNDLCKKHPELEKEIEAIEATIISASAATVKPLSPDIKNKIASKLKFEKENQDEAKVVEISDNRIKLYRFAIAATLLLFFTSVAYNFLLQNKVDSLNTELAIIYTNNSRMAQEFDIQRTSYNKMLSELAILTNPKMKKVALQGMNSMLNQSAAIHWNTETKEVFFNAGNMTPPAGKQYQLWAIVDGKPVDAGMIDLNQPIVFQQMKTINSAQAFAVTIENVGGSATPSLETMCLLGNV
jgi:anti-sigma-K factor RskA